MNHVVPLRFKPFGNNILFSNDAGLCFVASEDFLERYVSNELTKDDKQFLFDNGHSFRKEFDLQYLSHLKGITSRLAFKKQLSYLVLVPTLRCDLSCTYCQVSRVNVDKKGFDWSTDTLAAILQFIGTLETDHIKIEFQGGEPLLRPDLILEVIAYCEDHFSKAEFVICTNLSFLDEKIHAILSNTNVVISTSLDGGFNSHKKNRTKTDAQTNIFFDHLGTVIQKYGRDKVSALPTIDYRDPPSPEEIVSSYIHHGMYSIFLRPVNYVGFARKNFRYSKADAETWIRYYRSFLEYVITYNATHPETVIDEYYFTLCLRRIMQAHHNAHVDLRNPNYMGHDYLLIDHDGRIYPTDEARMITRTGQIDLCIGDIKSGLDADKVSTLNTSTFNNLEPDCIHCTYQPFCGKDVVDDLSRNGRIDTPKHLTYFCKVQTALFDLAFEYLTSTNPDILLSISRWLDMPLEHNGLILSHDTA